MKLKTFKRDLTAYLDQETRKAVGRYWEIYVYNSEEVTHCCEITPSYECHPITFETENEIDDQMYDVLQYGMADDPIYVHCHTVDPVSRPAPAPPDQFFQEDDEEYLQECLEYYRANCGSLS